MSELIKALKSLQKNPFNQIVCKIDSVDDGKLLCDVSPINGDAKIYDVRLAADGQKGFVMLPKVGSVVIVTMLDNDSAIVSMFSQVDKIYLLTSETENGGIIITSKLKTEIEKLNANFEAIKNAFTTWVPVPSDGGAALKTIMTGVVSSFTKANIGTNIENENIQH